jgi:peptidylprolyl isomerase
MRRPSRRGACLTLGAAALSLLLSSCGGSPAAAVPHVTGALDGVPHVTFPASSPPSTLTVKVLTMGTGPVVHKGDLLVANYVGWIWRGKVFDSSFQRGLAAAFPIGVGKVIPGWDKSLVGTRVGSRVLLVIPPADGYGAKGQPSAGITGTDTIVFVVDVLGTYGADAEGQPATTTLHTTVDGVTVTWAPHVAPVVTVAKGAATPKAASFTVLSRGSGRAVTPGTVVLQYAGFNATTGQVVQSTWQSGGPQGLTVATTGTLSPLIGVRVGSRLLLRLPKSKSGGPFDFVMDVVADPANL